MPRKRKRARPTRSALALRWLAAAVLLAVALAYVHPLRSYVRARGEVEARRAQLVELERANRRLERRLALAGTDEFVEREARRLALVRPGERLFIVKTERRKGARLR